MKRREVVKERKAELKLAMLIIKEMRKRKLTYKNLSNALNEIITMEQDIAKKMKEEK